jgi:hypothetical protein
MPELTRLRGGDDLARPADNNTPFTVYVRAFVWCWKEKKEFHGRKSGSFIDIFGQFSLY